MFKAAILAGGRGERLKPLTDSTPKPMLQVHGKPFLEFQLEFLKKYSLTDIVLCVGYRKETLVEYFGDGSRFGIHIEYSLEHDFLGTGGALKNAQEKLSDDFMLLYGDSFLPIDYADLMKTWRSGDGYQAMAVCYDNNLPLARNNVYVDESGLIRNYDKKHCSERMNYVEAGVSMFKKSVFSLFPDREKISLEEEVFPRLIENKSLKAYRTSQRYYDIGTLQGIKDFEESYR